MSKKASVLIELAARSNVGKAVAQAKSQIASLKAYMGSTQGKLATLGASIGLGFGAKQVYDVVTQYQRFAAQLDTLTGSAAEAERVLGQLKDYANRTPFELQQVTQAYIDLRVRGVIPTLAEFDRLGDYAAAFGTDIGDIVGAINSAVKGETEYLQRYVGRVQIEGNKVKLTMGDTLMTVDRTTRGVLDALVKIGTQNFAGGMERQFNTIEGRMSSLKDAVTDVQRQFGLAFADVVVQSVTDATTSVDSFKGGVQSLQSSIRGLTFFVVGFGKAALNAFTFVARAAFGLAATLFLAVKGIAQIFTFDWGPDGARESFRRIAEGWRDTLEGMKGDAADFQKAGVMMFGESQRGMTNRVDAPQVKDARDAVDLMGREMMGKGERAEKARKQLAAYRKELQAMAEKATDPEVRRAFMGLDNQAKLMLGGGNPDAGGGGKKAKPLAEQVKDLAESLATLGDAAPDKLVGDLGLKLAQLAAQLRVSGGDAATLAEGMQAATAAMEAATKMAPGANRALVQGAAATAFAAASSFAGAPGQLRPVETPRGIGPIGAPAPVAPQEGVAITPPNVTGGVRGDIGSALLDMAGPASERLDELDQQLQRIARGSVAALGDAFTSTFEAVVTGAPITAAAFSKAILGSVAAVAKAKGDYYLAESFAALGTGLLGDPRGFAAAAKYGAAAVGMYALAGIGGGVAANAGGGGSSFAERSRRSLNSMGAEATGEATIIVQGGFLDMTNPRQADQLARALKQLSGRRVVIESR